MTTPNNAIIFLYHNRKRAIRFKELLGKQVPNPVILINDINELEQHLGEHIALVLYEHEHGKQISLPVVQLLQHKQKQLRVVCYGPDISVNDCVLLYRAGVYDVLAGGDDEADISRLKELLLQSDLQYMHRDVESGFRNIIQNSLTGFILGRPDGKILDANQRACELFGYSYEEFINLHRLDIFDATEDNLNKLVAQRERERAVSGELTAVRKNGERFQVEFSSVIYFDEVHQEQRASTLINDISPRKQLERLLDETNELARVGGWEVNLVTRTLNWTKVVREIHELPEGYEPSLEEAIGFYKQGDSRERIMKAVNACINEGKAWDVETILITAKGNERWVRSIGNATFVNGKCVRIFGAFQDITQQKIAQQELVNSETKLRAFFNSTTDAICVLDKEYNIIAFNRMFDEGVYQLWGTHPHIGERIEQYATGEMLEMFRQNFARALTGEEIRQERYVAYNNKPNWWAISYIPVREASGDIIGVTFSNTNIQQRKLAEERLRSSEAELSQIFNTVSDVIFKLAVEGEGVYRFVKVNSAFYEKTGLTPLSVLNKTTNEVIPDVSRELVHSKYKEAITNRTSVTWEETTPYNNVTKTGIVTVTPYINEAGVCEYLIVSVHDITDRVQAEVIERKAAQRMALAAESAGIGIWEYNPVTEALIWDEQMYKLYGVNRENFTYHSNEWVKRLHPDDKEVNVKHLAEAISSGKVFESIFRINCDDGALRYIKAYGKNYQFGTQSMVVGVNYDITERIKSEEQLRQNKTRLKTILENEPECVKMVSLDGRLIDMNPAGLQMLEAVSLEAIRGKDLKPIIHPEDLDKYETLHLKACNGEASSARFRVINFANHLRWFESNAVPLRDPEGHITSVLSVSRDITRQVMAEQKLIENKQELEQIFNNVSDAIYVLEVVGEDLYKYTTVNEAFVKQTGLTTEQRLNQFVHEVVPAASVGLELEKYREAIASKSVVSWQETTDYPAGRKTAIHSATPMFNSDGVCYKIIGSARDITDIIEKQNEIKKLSMIATETINGAVITDIEGRIVWVNHAFERMFGYSLSEVQGKQPHHVLTGVETNPETIERILARQRNFEPFEEEIAKYKKNGERLYVRIQSQPIWNEQGQPEGFFRLETDITKQKNEEERLRLLESAIINTNDAVVITEAEPIDGNGPRIVYVNPAFTQMTGYTAQEVIGLTPRILQGEETCREALEGLKEALANWQPHETEIINYKKDGTSYWVNISVVPIADDKGWFTHWIAIERDVTARKKQEQEHKQLIEELSKNNADLKHFTFITSHNLRAPLSNLVAISSLIDDETINDEGTKELIDGFKKSTHHLNNTLNDLMKILLVKEASNVEVAEVYFAEVLSKLQASLKIKLSESGTRIETNFKVKKVLFSFAYLESVLLNLITNSLKYRSPERPLVIAIETVKTTQGIKLTFTDNGLGMDMKLVKDRIFGLYQRFHNHKDSKGIGLYLVKSQVEALGGKISVKSQVNEGTQFTITFKTK